MSRVMIAQSSNYHFSSMQLIDINRNGRLFLPLPETKLNETRCQLHHVMQIKSFESRVFQPPYSIKIIN